MATPFQFRLRIMLLAVMPVAFVALPIGYYLRRPTPVPASGIVNLNGTPGDSKGSQEGQQEMSGEEG